MIAHSYNFKRTATTLTQFVLYTNSMSIEKLKKHKSKVTVAVQSPGDLLIIPDGNAYQVNNTGTSFKVACDRKNIESLAETIT
ncbi:unnamed protein product [Cunninghamella blakesleeana]